MKAGQTLLWSQSRVEYSLGFLQLNNLNNKTEAQLSVSISAEFTVKLDESRKSSWCLNNQCNMGGEAREFALSRVLLLGRSLSPR